MIDARHTFGVVWTALDHMDDAMERIRLAAKGNPEIVDPLIGALVHAERYLGYAQESMEQAANLIEDKFEV